METPARRRRRGMPHDVHGVMPGMLPRKSATTARLVACSRRHRKASLSVCHVSGSSGRFCLRWAGRSVGVASGVDAWSGGWRSAVGGAVVALGGVDRDGAQVGAVGVEDADGVALEDDQDVAAGVFDGQGSVQAGAVVGRGARWPGRAPEWPGPAPGAVGRGCSGCRRPAPGRPVRPGGRSGPGGQPPFEGGVLRACSCRRSGMVDPAGDRLDATARSRSGQRGGAAQPGAGSSPPVVGQQPLATWWAAIPARSTATAAAEVSPVSTVEGQDVPGVVVQQLKGRPVVPSARVVGGVQLPAPVRVGEGEPPPGRPRPLDRLRNHHVAPGEDPGQCRP
jgi:hypothetical protein